MAAAESLGHQYGGMRIGDIIELDVLDAAVSEHSGQNLRGVHGVTVNRAGSDYDALILRGITAPVLVFIQEPADILAPDGTMQRADHPDLQTGGFFQQRLHLRTVFADNVRIIAAGVIQPFGFKIDFIRKKIAVQSAEGAESICGKECFIRCIIGDHDFRPMDRVSPSLTMSARLSASKR